MATDEQRLVVLDMLIKKYDSIVWRFLYEQTDPMGGMYMENARPKWRDDDAGSAQMRGIFLSAYYSALGERILNLAENNAERIAALIRRIDHFEGTYQKRLIALIKNTISFSDGDKEIVREALYHYLNWHNSYNTDGDKKAERLQKTSWHLSVCLLSRILFLINVDCSLLNIPYWPKEVIEIMKRIAKK